MLRTDSERPLHIALWSPAWPLSHYHNGIVTYAHWMRLALEAQGHRVSIITGEVAPGAAERAVYLVRRSVWSAARLVWGKRRSGDEDIFHFSELIAREILRVHRRDPIDVVEMEESFGWHAGVAQRTRIPVLVRLHGPAFLSFADEEHKTDFGRRRIDLEGVALRQAQMIVSPSRTTLLQTIKWHQITNPEVHHIVNPIAMEEGTPLWRLEDCNRDSILFVGRFDLRKGGDVVLRAFHSALRQRPLLRLVFVGPDAGLPGPQGLIHFEQYREQLFSPEDRNRVTYLGRMSNHDVTNLRTRSMVTVIGSRWENQGYAVLEAMFQGCPVVCTDAGGCPESVVHQVTGRLASSGNPNAFAAEMLAMIDDPAAAERLGQAARQYALGQHTPGIVAEASVQLYRRLLLRSNSAPLLQSTSS